MESKDFRNLQEAYLNVYYGQSDDITDVMIEEVVEELIEECVDYGYDLYKAVESVEEAATTYLTELNPYAPAGSKDSKAYNKSSTSTKRGEERRAAVKGAVNRVITKAKGVKAGAEIAGSIAKDEVRRAGRNALHAVGKAASAVGNAASRAGTAVTDSARAKKAEVKQGVKSLIGRGLQGAKNAANKAREGIKGAVGRTARKVSSGAGNLASRLGEEVDVYDLILSHLLDEGYADTYESAERIMVNMSEEWRDSIIETRLDPRGRPASGPMNVYANPKKPSQAHLDAVKAYDEKQKKKTPEQRKAELDAYMNRKMYS
jgi:ribosomal protein L7/L12